MHCVRGYRARWGCDNKNTRFSKRVSALRCTHGAVLRQRDHVGVERHAVYPFCLSKVPSSLWSWLIKLAQQISNDESLIIVLVYVGRRWDVVGSFACSGLLFTGKQMLQIKNYIFDISVCFHDEQNVCGRNNYSQLSASRSLPPAD